MNKGLKTTTRGFIGATLTALLVTGCGIVPSMTERLPDQDPDQLLSQAEQQEPSQAARSRLDAADILARQQRRPQAMEVIRNVDDTLLSENDRIRWALLLSDLGTTQGDPNAVIRAGQLLRTVSPPPEQTNLLLERLGRALATTDRPLESAAAFLRLQQATDRDDLNDAIWEQLVQLSPADLDRLSNDKSSLTQGWLELTATYRSGSNSVDQLLANINGWRDSRSNHPAARQLPSGIVALQRLDIETVTHIAVFLPESGPFANVSKALKHGIQTQHDQRINSGQSAPNLSFHDAAGGSLDSLYQQAAAAGAQVVLGPLSKNKVTELEQLDSVPLPTLALNYGKSQRNLAKGLSQYGLSAENEARLVARRGREDGHDRAAVLIPDNGWGRRVGEAFADNWREAGGEVSHIVEYNPKSAATESTRRAISSPKPDMLFLLALPDYARQVPPTLDYYNASELPVYATSHLYEGTAQRRLDKDLNGVMFVDIPWQIPEAATGGANSLPFSDSYRQLHESADPGLLRLMAMGVDAYELGSNLPYYQAVPGSQLQGATGSLSADQNGRIQRQLPWARFENGTPQPIIDTSLFDTANQGSQPADASAL
ncbi:penicillin-binding protein activator [Halomonas halocynthiae]|uniref:penicillin-binding protein activator n=1 Tax=Halomonas halocynthiae TaxID=176290 RepID=UPI00040E94C9|nr:penicillin-binding protein activator [Halomonas halocynthiae]